ncbi:hypothetical protein NE237_016040 [Protea cynaroides]|uniref:Fructose-1-6-bisphosphatase class 1 C-terminal domain-containing protein n=1 Tax=Protea cynaroides TaxID=273540 RepID=A0A9Q0KFH3_9MAGN|nr:hypothetical protein NE237_016040 [Protea cynaroides]
MGTPRASPEGFHREKGAGVGVKVLCTVNNSFLSKNDAKENRVYPFQRMESKVQEKTKRSFREGKKERQQKERGEAEDSHKQFFSFTNLVVSRFTCNVLAHLNFLVQRAPQYVSEIKLLQPWGSMVLVLSDQLLCQREVHIVVHQRNGASVNQIIVEEKSVYINVISPSSKAKLRLLFEVAPLGFLIENAGGCSSDGTYFVLDKVPIAGGMPVNFRGPTISCEHPPFRAD